MTAVALAVATVPPFAPAAAQVGSASLPQVNPWGMGALGGADSLPADIWAHTSGNALEQLLAPMKADQLSPAGRRALGRLMLSPAHAPEDSEAVLPLRVSLAEALGASDFASDLRRSFPTAPWSEQADLKAASLELATLRAQQACRRVAGKPADDPGWLPVRALCLAIAGDFDTAAVASASAVDADPAHDPWLLGAIETMRGSVGARAAGRYGSPFEIAVSVAAGLGVPAGAMDRLAPDLALAIVRHPSATDEQRRAALTAALPRLTSDDVLSVLNPPASDKPATARPSQKASRTSGATPSASDTLLKQALDSVTKGDLPPLEFGRQAAAALAASDSQAGYQIAALALAPAISRLPRSAETSAYAETFARAALVTRNLNQAKEWRDLATATPPESADPWSLARLDFLLGLARTPGVDGSAALATLASALAAPASAAPEPAPPAAKAPAKTSTPGPADLRRIEAARALFLHAGLARPLPPQGRALLYNQKAVGRGISDAGLLRAQAALDAGAKGEAALTALSLLQADVSAQSFAGLADLLGVLRQAGLESDAEALALESMRPWKSF